MEYFWSYVVFGALFVVGTAGYWIVTRIFTDSSKTYLPKAAKARGKAS